MKLISHPFNDIYGLTSVKPDTTKLILGSFPAAQVTDKLKPRLDFYYGSTDNQFWDIFKVTKYSELQITPECIMQCLDTNKYAIIDIVKRCYRKNGNSSADEDLAIIELQDVVKILATSKIKTICHFMKKISLHNMRN